jgi:eukaryotic-like serine/threonine-protein kinase
MEPHKQPCREPGGIIAGRYRLKERLAAGGVGEVWLAEHCHLKQEVAIKFIKEELFADRATALSVLERFRFESQVSAMLGRKTRHVVCVHDAGDSEAGPFLAMEYVPGSSLSDELKVYGPMQPKRLATILDQVADALGAAHAVGIVHRDIKPANILVVDQPDGSPFAKVADFGIAKAMNPDLPLDRPKSTSAMTLVGTPDFMSPEQVRSGPVQPAIDIWALGVTCYKLLTGALPFKATSRVDRIYKIVFEPFAPPSSLRPDLPAALDAWFSRALAKDPADRFVTVRAMSVAFRAAIGGAANLPNLPVTIPRPEIEVTIHRSEPTTVNARASQPERTTLTSATAHVEPPTERTRSGVRWGAVLAAAAMAATLAAGLLLVHGPKTSEAQGTPASQAQAAAPQSTMVQPTAPRLAGEPAPTALPHSAPESAPIIANPANPPSNLRKPSKHTSAPPAEPPREPPPAPSETAPAPAAPPPPRDPSTIL